MTLLRDVCRYVRSKNAGPFWITIDVFFTDADVFAAYGGSPSLATERVAAVLGVHPDAMRRFAIPELNVLKFSYPREHPQGGEIERDLHAGQQYVPLLTLEVEPLRSGTAA